MKNLILALLLALTAPAFAQRRAALEYEPTDPRPAAGASAWDGVPAGLQGAVGSLDRRYERGVPPDVRSSQEVVLTAWRGERVSAQVLVWSKAPLANLRFRTSPLARVSPSSQPEPSLALNARFVRYVRADQLLCGDILDTAERISTPERSTRPVWVSVDVPRDAKPGRYLGRLDVIADGVPPFTCGVTVEVLAATLPAPGDWSFYLDLWQNPYALARYHRVEPFSPEHLALMRPHLTQLAAAGQKVLTATILPAPWGGQTFDPYGSMVEWIRQPDGSFRWDYSVFDKYVAFGKSCGIGPWVNCYSMIPWTNRLEYRDAATGETRSLELTPATPTYESTWGLFLADFSKHLAQKGWLGQVRIAMDERPLPLMQAAWSVARKYAPKIPVALAGDNNAAFKDAVHDWCAYLTPGLDPATLAERAAKGLPTTFYVCCVPGRPNTFTFSPPAEATWIGLFAAGHGYTGFLRWAFDSWTEDPLFDTKHVTWDAGDCFLVYPGGRSSIRFERLREGIQEFEKVRVLRRRLKGTPELSAVDAALSKLTVQQVQTDEPLAPVVNAAKIAIQAASRKL